jgi:hypothetical protein
MQQQCYHRNSNVARLGVSCPFNSIREYVYDDTYFECTGSGFAFDGVADPRDLYSCADNPKCDGEGCVLLFGSMLIYSETSNFLSTCVEAIVPITAYPTTSPVESPSSETFSVQFEASWGNLFDPVESSSSCTMGTAFVILSCDNGASIERMSAIDSTIFCSVLSDSEIQCSVDASGLVNQFKSVVFVSPSNVTQVLIQVDASVPASQTFPIPCCLF